MIAFVDHCRAPLLPHALDGKATYLNYINSTLPNWEAYHGDNYEKLQCAKHFGIRAISFDLTETSTCCY